MGRSIVRAVIFDAGHTLLEMDYARLAEYLASRGHDVSLAAVTDADRRAPMALRPRTRITSTASHGNVRAIKASSTRAVGGGAAAGVRSQLHSAVLIA